MGTTQVTLATIEGALRDAMKARDTLRTSVLRLVRAALQNRAIEKRAPLTDEEVLAVLFAQAKQRRESVEQFRAGGRADLAAKEEAELAILQEFLPRAMDPEELLALAREVVAELGPVGPKDMGRVMAALMPRIRGRADGKAANQVVRDLLTASGASS